MKFIYFFSVVSVLAFSGCNPPAKNADNTKSTKEGTQVEILETYWKVIEINGQAVTNPPVNQNEAYIILKKDGNRLQGSGGCNSLTGTYELQSGNKIKFSGIAATMMACPDMTIESQLGKAIEMADNYAINGKYLMLHKAKMAPLVKFEAKE